MREIKFRAWDNDSGGMFYGGFSIHATGNVLKQHIPLHEKSLAVMQFTGLKDKNGVEIYEGDIVAWSKKYPAVEITSCCGDWSEHTNLEVIGNVYENPELLGDDNE